MKGHWQFRRNMGRVQLENYWPFATWSVNALPEEDSWEILLRREHDSEFGKTIARVHMRRLTETVWLSEKLWVDPDYRRKGISEKVFNVEKGLLMQLGGSILQAFVTDSNEAQVNRLQSLGWVRGNKYTTNECDTAHVWFYSPYGFVERG